MAFESLSEKMQRAFSKLKGKGTLSEKDIDVAMREIKLALLEADVSYKIVKEFVNDVKEKSLGSEVMKSLTPDQQVIKFVNTELRELMGDVSSKLTFSPKGFTIYMMVGLQGTGKTTTCAKLAKYLKEQGKKPMLAACDVYRPAAIDQLEVVGKDVGVEVYADREESSPVKIAKAAIEKAERLGMNVLILDTAGRLQIDEELMDELADIKSEVHPHEILLVVDALTGQDAVNTASGFHDKLGVDGVIMTKLDGDARGGAALSVKKVTGTAIKFVGLGEKFDEFEVFHPDRMADRILGMGDVLTLIEQAEQTIDKEQAEKIEKRLRKNQFTLVDFLEQTVQIKKMGGVAKLLGMMPGASKQMNKIDAGKGEEELKRFESIIYSMTPDERDNPALLNASRRRRISKGSGQPVSAINNLIKRYEEVKKMMKRYNKGGFKGKMGLPF
ncbi:signal recognition particle protein [Eubacterium saphenum ATCC 49989]|nr:signal recognition particle protein [Eubacterium saphenum ATCC 49989]